ncbi:MAG: hypothetical protein JXR71_03570 [Bacteroidales bacterium]|nr:hypothetical protein [Bacteroidales bacterium]
MKKTMYLIALMAIFVGLTGCEKKDGTVSSKVEIAVNDLSGAPVANETVYMFTDPSTETFGSKPIYAAKTSVTDENGVAGFDLQEVFDLDPVSTQTTLYFTILKKVSTNTYQVRGTIGVTVKKGTTYKKNLTVTD